jgi:hypothetical protein
MRETQQARLKDPVARGRDLEAQRRWYAQLTPAQKSERLRRGRESRRRRKLQRQLEGLRKDGA